MTHVVAKPCFGCRYTDCVVVCPVECFYMGPQMLYIHPEDAARMNLGDGSSARVTSERGSMDVIIELNERMMRGHMSLPNGMGLDYPDEQGQMKATGTSPNELTWSSFADEYVGTPWHKTVPVRIEAID